MVGNPDLDNKIPKMVQIKRGEFIETLSQGLESGTKSKTSLMEFNFEDGTDSIKQEYQQLLLKTHRI